MRSNILAFVFGVWLLQQQPSLFPIWWLSPVLLLIWPIHYFRGTPNRSLEVFRDVLVKLVWATAGFAWALGFAQHRISDALPSYLEGKYIDVIGVVASLPVKGDGSIRFEFDVEKVLGNAAHVPSHIQLSWFSRPSKEDDPAAPIAIHAGERWRLTVNLKRPHGNANPYGFDYEAWLLERNIRATGYVKEGDGNQRLDGLVYRPGYLIDHLREGISDRIDHVLSGSEYGPVLKALTVGDQSAIPRDQWNVFLRTGVNHLMSISGSHVTMFATMMFGLVYWLWKRHPRLIHGLPARKAAVLAGALAALAYALIAGFAVPAQRTFYMLAVVAITLWSGRITSAFTILCAALLAVVLLDPWSVLSPGFWLSFGAVAVILYVSINRIGRIHWLAEAGRVQWAVTLGLIPAMLLMFQQVSIISPVANAFAIPVVTLVVVPLSLAGAFIPLDFLLHLAHWIMEWTMKLLVFLSSASDAVWQQHAPPAWTAMAAVLGILWWMLPRGFPARWLGMTAMIPMILLRPELLQPGSLHATVLDIGQGLAVVVQTRHHAMLYDTGPKLGADSDSGIRTIIPYLRAEGIISLDGVVVSHDDSDHSGGAVSVLNTVPVGWLLSSLPKDSPIVAQSRNTMACYAGQKWSWDGVVFEVLNPLPDSYNKNLKDNARGCVIKVTSAFGSILLPADIERDVEGGLLARAGESLQADVLIAPHHGSKTSSTDAFIKHVNPEHVIFTVGYRNRFRHPRRDIVVRYKQHGSKTWRTDKTGAIDIEFTPEKSVTISTYRKREKRYWMDVSFGNS